MESFRKKCSTKPGKSQALTWGQGTTLPSIFSADLSKVWIFWRAIKAQCMTRVATGWQNLRRVERLSRSSCWKENMPFPRWVRIKETKKLKELFRERNRAILKITCCLCNYICTLIVKSKAWSSRCCGLAIEILSDMSSYRATLQSKGK